MDSRLLTVRTGTELVTDLSADIASFCSGRGDGLVNVFLPHATAGVAVVETGDGSEPDIADLVDRILPTDVVYNHRHGSVGHGRDHVLPALVSPSVTLPVLGGRIQLGTWQSIVVLDPNVDNPVRQVRVSFIAG